MSRQYVKSVDRVIVGWYRVGLIYHAIYEDERDWNSDWK